MKCFNYKVYDGGKLILTNWINRETKAEAYNDLKDEYQDCTIKLNEVCPASNWSCQYENNL